MTQPQSQRELCALCSRLVSPTHSSSPQLQEKQGV